MAEEFSIVPKTAFFEISQSKGGQSNVLGKVEFTLFANAPRTAVNFGRLCQGPYKNVFFHRVIPNFMCQFGDTTEAKFNPETGQKVAGPNRMPGTGGVPAIGGNKFSDDLFINKHKVGALSMANAGKNTNGSQIFICTAACTHLDDKHVVFGEVKSGMDVIKAVEGFGSGNGEVTGGNILYVSDAGVSEYHPKSAVEQFLIPKKAFYKVTVNGELIGQINMTLYKNTPWTSINFGGLCKGFSIEPDKVVSYANTFFHRIIPNFMCQFGDVTEAKVEGNKKIAGPNRRPGTGGIPSLAQVTRRAKFQDEIFVNPHGIGKLSMANSGPNTNGSQIFMCTAPCNHLNGKHVVFGEVDSQSMSVVKQVESFGSQSGETSALVVVSEAGVTEYYSEEESFTNAQSPL